MPLTLNGKIDRAALAATEARLEARPAFVAAQTELERAIAAIWQEVLQIESVGVHDNFFDLGGHSLLIVRVHNKLQEQVSRELPIVELFKHPTIKSLVEWLTQPTDAGLFARKIRLQIEKQKAAQGQVDRVETNETDLMSKG
jgi:acyl carrier protein